MNFFPLQVKLGWRGVLAVGALAAVTAWWRRSETNGGKRRQRRGRIGDSVPQTAGAESAVTGGPPEDMNGMPPVPMDNPLHDTAPIYDGSTLDTGTGKRRHA